MEKIRIGKEKQLYEIESIRQISSKVLQVVFSGPVPASWGDITIYTSGDVEATTLTGYETVYRNEGQTVYLSNDGSIYTAPEISYGPSEPPDPYVPTLKEVQAAMRHVSYHTTYCNALNMWIAECKTINEASEIFYGADVPAEYQSEVLKTYLAQTDTEIGVEADGTQEE